VARHRAGGRGRSGASRALRYCSGCGRAGGRFSRPFARCARERPAKGPAGRCGWRSRAWSGSRRPQPRNKLPAGLLVLVHDLGWRRRARVANRRAPPQWWRDLRSRTVGAGAQYAGLITQGFWGSWPTKTY
jgi:hypothetical protein